MSPAYKAEALSFGGLFSGPRLFKIPLFQRSYSWTFREVGQLMTDLWQGLEESSSRGSRYGGLFLGSLVVVDNREGVTGGRRSLDAADALHVIDGKQRLATLTILMATLRDKLGSAVPWIEGMLWRAEAPDRQVRRTARLTLCLEEESYFGVQVRRPGATAEPLEPEGESLGPRSIRECQLTILQDFEDRNADDLAKLAHFVRDEVAFALISAPDLDTGFRVFVSTNHRGKPLTSTDILKAELISELPEAEREAGLERWRNAERSLGDDFTHLPALLRMIYGSRQGSAIRDMLDLSEKYGGAKPFLDDILFPMAEALQPILGCDHKGAPQSPAINISLRLLSWLRARDWVGPALAFMIRAPGKHAEFAEFIDRLDRLAYGLQVVCAGSDRRAARYRAIIEALETGGIDAARPLLALTPEEQNRLMLHASTNLYHRNSTTCKYLLKRISASYPGDAVVETLDDVSIEHVLPTSVSAKSPWVQEIPDADERVTCNKMLGNMVLVSVRQNREAGNRRLDQKLAVIFPGGQPSPHAITNHLIGARSWNAADIRARDRLLMQRIREIWGLSDAVGNGRGKPDRST